VRIEVSGHYPRRGGYETGWDDDGGPSFGQALGVGWGTLFKGCRPAFPWARGDLEDALKQTLSLAAELAFIGVHLDRLDYWEGLLTLKDLR
jgi:hypothetical protein